MSKHNSKIIIRITLLGDKGVGKTSLMNGYVDAIGGVTLKTSSSQETAHSFETVVDDMHVRQEILDSDGKNTAVTAWAHGVIVMYTTNDYQSFLTAEECISVIKEVTMRDAIIVLVGNHNEGEEKIISIKDGEKLASRYGCYFMELSIKEHMSDITQIMNTLSRQILLRRGLIKSSTNSSPGIIQRMIQAVRRRSSTVDRLNQLKMEFREEINTIKESNI